jgi:hypothetical protein
MQTYHKRPLFGDITPQLRPQGERLIAAASRNYLGIRFYVIRLPTVGTNLIFRPQVVPVLTPDKVGNSNDASLAFDLDHQRFDIISLSDDIE